MLFVLAWLEESTLADDNKMPGEQSANRSPPRGVDLLHCITVSGCLHPLQVDKLGKKQGVGLNVTAVKNLRPLPQHVFTDGFKSE